MPLAAPAIKIAAVERLGGEVQLVGESYTETEAFAKVQALACIHFQHQMPMTALAEMYWR